MLVVGSEGPLFYANATALKDRVHALVRAAAERPRAVVLELAESADLDVGTLDALAELAGELGRERHRAAARRRAPAGAAPARAGGAGRPGLAHDRGRGQPLTRRACQP